MACAADRQAGASARVQRRGDPGLSHNEGAVWHAPPANYRVRRKPPSSGRAGLESPGLQHPVPPSENTERRHPVPWRIGTSPLADRCHRDQG